MAFFLRYTDKAEIDLARKTSVHLCDSENQADEFISGVGHVQFLNGLCGFEIESENEEDAIEEAVEYVLYHRQNFHANSSGEEFGRHAFLFEGKISGDCIDGVLFMPKRIVKNITEIA